MFRSKRRATERKNWAATPSVAAAEIVYPTRMSFYNAPPNLGISLEDFEEWAIDRLRVLSKLQQLQLSGKTGQKDLEAGLKSVLEKYLGLGSNRSLSDETTQKQRQKDHYSHYILRLVYCRTPELRKEFVEREKLLFRYRLSLEDAAEKEQFVNSLDFEWEKVNPEEFFDLQPYLEAVNKNETSRDYVKVDWQKVPDLVDSRRVFLRAGKVYVPASLQQNLVVNEFESRLATAMETSAMLLSRLDESTRLMPILDHLAQFGVTETFTKNEALDGKIGPSNIDSVVKHMPLCMSQLHTTLRQKNHLKHDGRFQYNLFIKGLGFSVDEALQFWREAFKLTNEKFNKEYQYNILHNYGLKGSGKNYAPKDCKSIIANNPPANSELVHGCPYRSLRPEELIGRLKNMGIEDRMELNKIQDQVKNTNYHGACTRVLELTHPGLKVEEVIQHPNDYFLKAYGFQNGLEVEYTK
ncbi:DNA primase large subunit [Yarrowia sp. B02]|nr:DNA primase large subunit [Yarrowia sp. B02]